LKLFDLLFLVLFLVTLIAMIVAAYQSLRGRIAKAGRVVLGSVIVWAIYLAVVIAVSLSTPRREVAIGEVRCFDDWCVAVAAMSPGPPFAATLRVSSRGARIRQGAPDTFVYLEDSAGKKIAPRTCSGPAFATKISSEESYEKICEFGVAAGERIAGLVVRHGSTGPVAVIIGDDAALFHKPAIVPIRD
jgi:hypothetical protein